MSRLTTGITGAIALLLISGAAQFALGRDLAGLGPDQTDPSQTSSLAASVAGEAVVNRGAKADRVVGLAGSRAQTRTISLKLDGLSDTSILLRLPMADGTGALVPSAAKPLSRRPMLACEPVVSVLTEIVRQLPPGRCVT